MTPARPPPGGTTPGGTTPGRTTAVDTIRAVALIGICAVNLPFMGLPLPEIFGVPASQADQIAQLLTATLLQSKLFVLFSLMFGWGLHAQQRSAARAGTPLGPRYARRLLGLAFLGVAHATLVFSGDILVLYALLGLLLWPLRAAAPRTLIRWTLAMIPVAIAALIGLGLLIDDPMALASPGNLGGSFADATRHRLADWPPTFGVLLLFQGPMAFGAFTAGLAAAKTDFFEPASRGRATLRRAAPICLVLGLALNLAIALCASTAHPAALLSLLGIPIAAPLLSVAWLHLILWADTTLRLPAFFTLAGRNSATAYVLQGIIAGATFGGYGLGLFGRLGQAALLPLSLGIALLAMGATAVMAKRWGRGPIESLLRAITRGPG